MDLKTMFLQIKHRRGHWRKRAKKGLQTIGKLILLSFWPVFFASLISAGWYFFLYQRDRHLDTKQEGTITSAWIPACFFLYSLLYAIALSTVWEDYRKIRLAVKQYDFNTFMDFCDEELSPLLRAVVILVSVLLLLEFMALQYSGAVSGLVIIFGTSFLLALMYWIILEIDDPCSGLWCIKSIPKEWLEIEPKNYRDRRSEETRKKFEENYKQYLESGVARPSRGSSAAKNS